MGPKIKRCDWSLSLKTVHSQITSLTVGDTEGNKMPKVQNKMPKVQINEKIL